MTSLRAVQVAAAAWLLSAVVTPAVETRFWEMQGYGDFLGGELDGVSLRPSGELMLAPDLVRIPLQPEDAGPPTPFLWDAVLDPQGNLYIGSGLRGVVYRIDPRGEATVFFEAPEIEVQALAIDAEGRLLVGASPPGRLYRVTPEGDAVLMFETGERYIWDLAVDGESVWVATGESGILFRVSADGEGDAVFDSDEPHLVSLALAPDHAVIAGSSGSGLVYRVQADGGARVLFDADGQEVAGLAVLPSGTIYAGVNSTVPPEKPDKEAKERKEPKEKLAGEMPEGPTPAPGGVEDLGRMDEELSLSATPRQEALRLRSTLYRIEADGSAAAIWNSGDEGLHSLAGRGERVMFGTGVPARLYLQEGTESPRLLARFPESQVTSISIGDGGVMYAITSNQGRVYRASEEYGHSGTFLSPVRDAGAGATWGAISWEARAPAGTRVEMTTRSGNSSRPDGTWSDWSQPYAHSDGSRVASPSARYLQFRTRLSRLGDAASPGVRRVSVSYREENLPPQVSGLEAPAPSEGTTRQVRWTATDPNGDRLSHDLAYRLEEDGSGDWAPIARELTEAEQAWDTSALASGLYRLQVRTTDLPDNDAATARTAIAVSDPFVVDHQPPQVEILSSSTRDGVVRVSLRVTDDFSPVVRAEVSAAGLATRRLPAEDGLDDSREEQYELVLEDLSPGSHTLLISARDRAGNRREIELPVEVAR